MDGFEHRRPPGMQVGRRRHPQAALQRCSEVRDDIAEEVVGHDDVELRRILDEHQRQGVDVKVRGLDRRVVRPQLVEHALPERVPLAHRVALVGHADTRTTGSRGVLEGVRDDAMNARIGVELRLQSDFVVCVWLEPAAHAHVQALGVFAEDDEVDIGRAATLERTQTLVEQPDGTIVHIEVELEPCAEQDVARMAVVGHARIAERADEDRIELAQGSHSRRREW
jgi:hypothetical protein